MAGEMLCGQIDLTTGETVLCDACREIAQIEAMYNDEDRCEHGRLYTEFCWDCVDRSGGDGG